MALAMMNDASNVGPGKFVRTSEKFYDPAKKAFVKLSTIKMDKALTDRLALPDDPANAFSAPMGDPNDVSKLLSPGVILEGPSLERAENTARHLQKNRFTIDHDYVDQLTAADLGVEGSGEAGPTEGYGCPEWRQRGWFPILHRQEGPSVSTW